MKRVCSYFSRAMHEDVAPLNCRETVGVLVFVYDKMLPVAWNLVLIDPS